MQDLLPPLTPLLLLLYTGKGASEDPQYRGMGGPINVMQEPQDITSSPPGQDFYHATVLRYLFICLSIYLVVVAVIDDSNRDGSGGHR